MAPVWRVRVTQSINSETRVLCGKAPGARVFDLEPQVEVIPTTDKTPPSPDALDISADFQNSTSYKSGYGLLPSPKRFGAKQRKAILCSGAALEQMYPLPSQSCFLTGTLPAVGTEAMAALAQWSGYAVNLLTQWFRYSVPCPYSWFFVWEWQQRGALHLHLVFAAEDERETARISDGWKFRWASILRSIGEKAGVNMFLGSQDWSDSPDSWQFDAQVVEKSVARYLSKYASKDKDESAKRSALGETPLFYPSQWWGSSRNIKAAVASGERSDYWYLSESEAKELASELRQELRSSEPCSSPERSHYEFPWKVVRGSTTVHYVRAAWDSIHAVATAAFERLSRFRHAAIARAADTRALIREGIPMPAIVRRYGVTPAGAMYWAHRPYAVQLSGGVSSSPLMREPRARQPLVMQQEVACPPFPPQQLSLPFVLPSQPPVPSLHWNGRTG